MINNGNRLDINKETDINGISIVLFFKNSTMNLISITKLINLDFRIYIDIAIETPYSYSSTTIE